MRINAVLYGVCMILSLYLIHCINRNLLILDYGRKQSSTSNIMQRIHGQQICFKCCFTC